MMKKKMIEYLTNGEALDYTVQEMRVMPTSNALDFKLCLQRWALKYAASTPIAETICSLYLESYKWLFNVICDADNEIFNKVVLYAQNMNTCEDIWSIQYLIAYAEIVLRDMNVPKAKNESPIVNVRDYTIEEIKKFSTLHIATIEAQLDNLSNRYVTQFGLQSYASGLVFSYKNLLVAISVGNNIIQVKGCVKE